MIIKIDMSSYTIDEVSAIKIEYKDEMYCPTNQPTLGLCIQQQKNTLPASMAKTDIAEFLMKMYASEIDNIA